MNESKKRRIVLSTRPPVPGDEEWAQKHHIRLVSCPAYSYHWITPPPEILEIVSSGLPDAWVFTSWRGAEGWHRVWDERMNRRKRTGFPSVYAVGDKTAAIVRTLFNITDVQTAEHDNGKSLALKIRDDDIQHAVHFCGNVHRRELSEIVTGAGIQLTEAEVYRRSEIQKPDPEIRDLCNSGETHAILFYSPDGVEGFSRLYGLPEGSWIPVAIGSTTADAVLRITGREPLIAGSPVFHDMIRLV